MTGNPSSASPRDSGGPARPSASSYLRLNASVWAFIAILAAVTGYLLGSARGIMLFAAILAAGFTAVSIFDYLWLRLSDRGDGRGA